MGTALPALALGTTTAKDVFAFDDASCVALADGRLKCFGDLPYPLIAEMTFSSPVKKLVLSGRGTNLWLERSHACALLDDESLRCWGSNQLGALGFRPRSHRSPTTQRSAPRRLRQSRSLKSRKSSHKSDWRGPCFVFYVARRNTMRAGLWLYPFLLIALFAMAATGCGYADTDGKGPKLVKSSQHEASESGGDEGGGEGQARPEDPVLTPEKAGDAKPASTPSTTCAVNDLALCFTFEGATKDQSTAPLDPAEASNIAFVAGKEGQAASFGTSSALRFKPNIVFELPSGAATVEAWIKRPNGVRRRRVR